MDINVLTWFFGLNYLLTVDWQIVQVLQQVCRKESLNLPPELARRIAEMSTRNLRRALLMCETCRVQQYPFSADQHITLPDWELFLRETARLIVQQQTPRRLGTVLARDVIYTSRAYATMSVSVCLSVMEVHWRIIANLGFEFRSQFTVHCGHSACWCEHWTIYSSVSAREGIIAGKSGEIISHNASHC